MKADKRKKLGRDLVCRRCKMIVPDSDEKGVRTGYCSGECYEQDALDGVF